MDDNNRVGGKGRRISQKGVHAIALYIPQLELAASRLTKELDFAKQHGPVRVIMKDGKKVEG